MNVEKNASVANDIVSHVVYIVDGGVVSDVARNNTAIGNTYGDAEIMILKDLVGDASDTAQPEEMVVADHVGIEGIGHHDLIPVGRRVAVLHQSFDLIGTKVTPTIDWFFDLLVAIEILIMSIVEVFLVDEVFVYSVVG